MKTIIFLILTLIIFTSCEKFDDSPVRVNNILNDSLIDSLPVWDNMLLHRYTFICDKNIIPKKYIKYVAYDSEDKDTSDKGQVNIYEIEAFYKGENVAINHWYTDTFGIIHYGDEKGVITFSNSMLGLPPEPYKMYGSLPHIVDSNYNSRWSSNRDDGQDTVFVLLEFPNQYKFDSIRVVVKYRQIFDMFVSTNSHTWSLIGDETYPYVEIPHPID